MLSTANAWSLGFLHLLMKMCMLAWRVFLHGSDLQHSLLRDHDDSPRGWARLRSVSFLLHSVVGVAVCLRWNCALFEILPRLPSTVYGVLGGS